jgi:hypothetical protein
MTWIEDELAAAMKVPAPSGPPSDHQKTAMWLQALAHHEIPATEVLATLAAVYLHAQCDPRRYFQGQPAGDRFLRVQLVNRMLRLGPPPRYESWRDGKTRWVYRRISVGVQDLLSTRLLNALGVIVKRIADAILARYQHETNRSRPVEGSGQPFPT